MVDSQQTLSMRLQHSSDLADELTLVRQDGSYVVTVDCTNKMTTLSMKSGNLEGVKERVLSNEPSAIEVNAELQILIVAYWNLNGIQILGLSSLEVLHDFFNSKMQDKVFWSVCSMR